MALTVSQSHVDSGEGQTLDGSMSINFEKLTKKWLKVPKDTTIGRNHSAAFGTFSMHTISWFDSVLYFYSVNGWEDGAARDKEAGRESFRDKLENQAYYKETYLGEAQQKEFKEKLENPKLRYQWVDNPRADEAAGSGQ